jgi:hypothetical protein
LSTIRSLIAAEIARRDNSIDMMPAFTFMINDRPGALTDTATAVTAIIEQTEKGDNSPMVCVARAIGNQVADALERKFPRRTIVSSPIVGPSDSMRERGKLCNEPQLEVGRDHDAVGRAADRLAEMRDGARDAAG